MKSCALKFAPSPTACNQILCAAFSTAPPPACRKWPLPDDTLFQLNIKIKKKCYKKYICVYKKTAAKVMYLSFTYPTYPPT